MHVTRRGALRALTASASGAALAQQPPIAIASQAVEVTLTTVSPQTVRIAIQPLQDGVPRPIPSDGALVRDSWGPPAARFARMIGTRRVRCGDLTVTLSGPPFGARVEANDGRLIQELRYDEAGRLLFTLGDGPLLGLGQGGPQFDRRGQADRMVSGQAGYRLGTHGGKVPIQLAIGTSGWAIYIHQPLGAFDLTGREGVFEAPAPLPLDLFVIGAREPAAVLAEYARITGHPAMPPLWAFGYQQSHRTLGPPEEILEEARTFRQKKLPCDAMIYLGTDFCPNGWNTHNGEFQWNPKAFPDPKRALDGLHDEHMKVVLHTVLEGRRLTGSLADACAAPPLPSGRTPDGRWPPDRQASCYWPVHQPLLDLGIDGWWPDQGDGLDGPSRLARIRMYFDGTLRARPNQRVYALHRNGYAGMQRYGAFLWSGDVQSTWETLRTHVAVAINAGLSGIPFWGTDIGGFIPTPELTGELYVRWFQFSAFCPLFRSHGRNWRLRLPWGWNTGEMGVPEVANYHPDPAELHNPAVEPICRQYLELRYRLLPYLYSAVKETCDTGLPIVRALWLHYPGDPAAVARGDEYLFGRDILAAPVVEKGAVSRTLYLPRGLWYDFRTRDRIEGGREVTARIDLAAMPLYIRAGAVLPVGPVKQHVSEESDDPLEVWVHPGAPGTSYFYEDDGTSFAYRTGEFERVEMAWDDRRRRLSLRPAGGSKTSRTVRRPMLVRVAGEPLVREVAYAGRPIEVKL